MTELAQYIQKNLLSGFSEQAVKQTLANSGYSQEQIQAGFSEFYTGAAHKKSGLLGKFIFLLLGIIIGSFVSFGLAAVLGWQWGQLPQSNTIEQVSCQEGDESVGESLTSEELDQICTEHISDIQEQVKQKQDVLQFAQARDTTRRADLYAITNAIYQYAVENNGVIPESISKQPTEIGLGENKVDLSQDLVPSYLAEIPFDPYTGTASASGYVIYLSDQGRLVSEAKSEVDEGKIISVTR